ncbi:MAG: outer membrane lipoprotein carrier protein LolA [Deltaproteobacteria bacterium]|nr:outer membrane lipoprotein carrier protein LolA [Deltaproteobacteria bacterium]
MRFKLVICILCTLISLNVQHALCKDLSMRQDSKLQESNILLDKIIDKVEKKYVLAGFSACFVQESTLKAMDITDSASGKITVKRPDKMRWEYEKPDKQIIVTDGKNLWVYRPDDNQVIIGKFPSFFGDGKGASFLSDIKLIKQQFNITLENTDSNDYYILKLLPLKKTSDLSYINLSISKKTFYLEEIVTYNAYGDETRIKLIDIKLLENPNDSIFIFNIPYGTDVLKLDE